MRSLVLLLLLFCLIGCARPVPPPLENYNPPQAYVPPPYVAPSPPPPPAPPPGPNYNSKSLLMKAHMTEKEVTDLLGPPTKADLRTCGAKFGAEKAWSCKLWSYGAYLKGGMTIDFYETASGEWRVNSWNVF